MAQNQTLRATRSCLGAQAASLHSSAASDEIVFGKAANTAGKLPALPGNCSSGP